MAPINTALYTLILILAIGCNRNTNPCNLTQEVLADVSRLDSLTQIPELRKRDQERLDFYKEPSLIQAQAETFRFMMEGSFGNWKVIRIEKKENQYTLFAKAGQSRLEQVTIDTSYSISKAQGEHIFDNLEKMGFWTYQTTTEARGVLDGTAWTLEGHTRNANPCTSNHYHYIYRYAPNDDQFIAMCKLLLELNPDKK